MSKTREEILSTPIEQLSDEELSQAVYLIKDRIKENPIEAN